MIYEKAPAGFVKVNLAYGPYSPSRLIVAKCPQRFYGQYIRKDKSVVHTLASARGSAIHEILEQITMKHVRKEEIGISEFNKWITDAIGKFPASYEQSDMIKKAAQAYVGNPSPYITENTTCEAAFAVELWEEDSFFDDAVKKKVFVKVPYDIDGKPNPNAFFGGRLDQITVDHGIRAITILDHKSTPSANVNEDHTFQVGAYAWLISLHYPGYTMKTVIHYAHPDLNFYAAPVVWEQEDLDEIGSMVLTKIAAVESFQEYEPLPSNSCDYCHMAQECGMYLKMREQLSKGSVNLNTDSVADLVRIAEELTVVGKLYDDLNSTLKRGVEKLCPDGGVAIQGIRYFFKASDESVDWIATDVRIREEAMRARRILEDSRDQHSPEAIAGLEFTASNGTLDKLMAAYDVDSSAFKSWQGQKLKNIWKLDKPELIERLKKYIVRDKSTKFGGYKA